jgi:oligopeptide/dipeptide ABC transporter ATP-binding protein
VPDPSGARRERQLLAGDVPSPANPPRACRFHTRCPKAQERCATEAPLLVDKGSGTEAACHFPLTEEEVRTRLPVALTQGRQRGPAPAASADPASAPGPAQ